jgi:cytochrome c oxidase cbb3-type subunit 3
MTVEQRDDHTGYLTTGHEWNGITELNTPVPRPVYFFLAVTFLFAVGYWILMPAWPIGVSYTRGLLGVDQRDVVRQSLEQAAAERRVWTGQIEARPFAEVAADPRLMNYVRQTGHRLFADNCAACHGQDAKGGRGFPNLTTTSWLWGGTPEAIAETIRVGINSAHPNSRVSQMPALGHDGVIPAADIPKVVAFVRSLSEPSALKDTKPEDISAGQALFATNCAACHGEDAKGNSDLGSPDLTDRDWIYGGEPETILATVWGGRQGHMPTWESRLSTLDRKILSLYIVDLRAKP